MKYKLRLLELKKRILSGGAREKPPITPITPDTAQLRAREHSQYLVVNESRKQLQQQMSLHMVAMLTPLF